MNLVGAQAVVIRWESERTMVASVRDAAGIADLRLEKTGWICSRCPGLGPCSHMQALRAVASVATS